MLVNNQLPLGEYRHNWIRLGFVVGTLLLFIGHVAINHLYEEGHNRVFPNASARVEQTVFNDITPSYWTYRVLNAFNCIWQFAFLLYSLTFLYRRSSTGYLYLAPNTLTPTFYIVYTLGFVVQSVWLLVVHLNFVAWSWLPYLISFLLLSLALFILNNNLALNKHTYETEGLNRDVWLLRFLAQNGVAFFASWTGVRFALAFDVFLNRKLNLSIVNAGTITLILIFLLALGFFLGPNLNAVFVEQCAYQFSPWIVFILYFWGVVENNWIPKNATRNNIISVVELVFTLISGAVAFFLFMIRYRASKIDRLAA